MVGALLVSGLGCGVQLAPNTRPGRGAWVGTASWYGSDFHGRQTASGVTYDMYKLTAAHRELPFGTRVKVTHLENRRSVVVEVNDRGPFVGGRIIDLSYGAARQLNMVSEGVARVRLELVR